MNLNCGTIRYLRICGILNNSIDEEQGANLWRRKVLIADDDQVVHEALGIYLKAEGFEVVDAFDGVSAIESITPEVVLCVLDIMMPKMSRNRGLPRTAQNFANSDSDAHGKGARRSTASSALNSARMTISSSRSARARLWRASRRFSAAASEQPKSDASVRHLQRAHDRS